MLRYEGAEPRIRVDLFLAESELGLSRSQIRHLINDGRVSSGGKLVKTSTKLRPGDEVQVRCPQPRSEAAIAQKLPLTILYEDNHLIVIDKAAGMVVHPAPGHPDGTVVNALLFHCKNLSSIGGGLRPGIVHRIDKDTSGILVVSKEDYAHEHLADGFKNKRHLRVYLGISAPVPRTNQGKIDTLHGRHPVHRKRFSSEVETGKRAVTHFEVKRHFAAPAALMSFRLETGRTHQIRVHCADSGFPLLGDPLYGRLPRSEPLRGSAKQLARQALHAAQLEFSHPITGKWLRFESQLPPDMQAVVDSLD